MQLVVHCNKMCVYVCVTPNHFEISRRSLSYIPSLQQVDSVCVCVCVCVCVYVCVCVCVGELFPAVTPTRGGRGMMSGFEMTSMIMIQIGGIPRYPPFFKRGDSNRCNTLIYPSFKPGDSNRRNTFIFPFFKQ